MDTQKSLEQQHVQEQKVQEQQVLQEQKEGSIGSDWVNVETETATMSRIQRAKMSEVANVEEPQVQKAMGDLLLYKPFRLTDEKMAYNGFDEEKDRAVKTADLKTFNFEQLADWAYTNARVRGADSSFRKLVENLVNLRELEEEMYRADSEEAAEAYRSVYEKDINSLGQNVDSYFKSHNKLIVFSEKGRLRLQLCRSLKAMMDNGLESELHKKADDALEIQKGRIPLVKKYEEANSGENFEFVLAQNYTAESEEWKEKYMEKLNGALNTLLEFRKDKESKVDEFEKSVVATKSSYLRRELYAIFKYGTPDAKDWNADVVEAMKACVVKKDEKPIYKIVERMINEVCDFEITPEMLDRKYAFEHYDMVARIDRLSQFSGNLADVNFTGALKNGFTSYKEKNPEMYDYFLKKGDLLFRFVNYFNTTMLDYGISVINLKINNPRFNMAEQVIPAEDEELKEYNAITIKDWKALKKPSVK